MRNLRTFLLITALGFNYGCSDILEEESRDASTIENFFQTTDNLEAAITATYRQLTEDPWNRGLSGARHRTIFCGADDWTSQPGGNKGDFKEGDELGIRSSNVAISNAGWGLSYDVILQANFCIKGQSDLIGRGADEQEVNQIVSQAYFLRAWAYFRLVRLYGGVPIVLQAESGPADFGISRSTVEEVYQQILNDLEVAIEDLPEVQPERGRINRWAAKALRANVYLTMGSWPLKQTDKFANALADANDVLMNGPYQFEEAFAPMFLRENEDTNTEYIWQLKFCNNIDCQGQQLLTPFASQTTKPAELGGFQDIFVEKAYFNRFPEGARKDHSFLTQLIYEDGTIQPWQEFIWKHPFFSKFYDGGVDKNAPVESQRGTSAPISDLDYPMIRITEMMMIYAEANSMGGGGDAGIALNYLNMVRRRGKGVDVSSPDVDDLATFTRQDVIDERGWEFLGEMKRWFDLIRTETLADALSDRDADELPLLGDPNNQNLYYHPLPDLDLQINSNLTQNPR
ncbi:MAG: RagB/SusD family nutrient uptake outer membrane protein [Ekhidna sp.]|nr:RagB/SusD family nutrient uptake outer membrane protein [Ekhidna sp.]